MFTGSLNTSHNSYLPQLKQVFKYKDGAPQFLGYKPMNSAGFLSEYHYSPEQIKIHLENGDKESIVEGISKIEKFFKKTSFNRFFANPRYFFVIFAVEKFIC